MEGCRVVSNLNGDPVDQLIRKDAAAEIAIQTVLDSLDSAHSRRAYERHLREFIAWHRASRQEAINKAGRITRERMTEQAIYNVVTEYADAAGCGEIAPHDLRRTFAKLAHKGGSALDQIQLSLGHGSIQTTERYLGVEQDLTDAPCDHLGLRL